MSKSKLIFAATRDHGIGINRQLRWQRLGKDMLRFRDLTTPENSSDYGIKNLVIYSIIPTTITKET